jgi:hypothetical protein
VRSGLLDGGGGSESAAARLVFFFSGSRARRFPPHPPVPPPPGSASKSPMPSRRRAAAGREAIRAWLRGEGAFWPSLAPPFLYHRAPRPVAALVPRALLLQALSKPLLDGNSLHRPAGRISSLLPLFRPENCYSLKSTAVPPHAAKRGLRPPACPPTRGFLSPLARAVSCLGCDTRS